MEDMPSRTTADFVGRSEKIEKPEDERGRGRGLTCRILLSTQLVCKIL